MNTLNSCLLVVVLVIAVVCVDGAKYAPPSGKTYQMVGQEEIADYQSYIGSTRFTPAGGSIYGTLFSGTLNPDSATFLPWIAKAYPNALVEVGLSWKDSLAQFGYDDCNINAGHGCYTIQATIDIANGKWDSGIDRFAQTLKQYSSLRYLIRIDYEVSNCFHANTDHSGCNYNTADFTKYPLAFAHVKSRIAGTNGLTNADFIFHAVRGQSQQLYPGDSIVDWLGLSVFNNDLCFPAGTTQNCQGQTVDPNIAHDYAFAVSHSKPRIISESSPQQPVTNDPSQNQQYISRMISLINTYDIGAWVYINQNWPAHSWGYPWGNSLVNRTSQTLSDWDTLVVANSRFLHY